MKTSLTKSKAAPAADLPDAGMDEGEFESAGHGANETKGAALLRKLRSQPFWRLETGLVAGAIACGILSGVLSHANQEATETRLKEIFATTKVYVAAKDLPFGVTLDQGTFREKDVLTDNATSNHVTEETLRLVLGRRLGLELKEGDPILLSAVQGASEVRTMAEKIPPGKRLFTLTIADTAAAYGFIKPNDHVDILAHINLPGRGMTTFTVLQDVTLVSVGASTVLSESGEATGSDVSFFADAKSIEMLAFAQKRGTFSLSLRNPQDIGTRKTGKGIDLNEFLDYEGIHEVSGGGELKVTEQGQLKEKKK